MKANSDETDETRRETDRQRMGEGERRDLQGRAHLQRVEPAGYRTQSYTGIKGVCVSARVAGVGGACLRPAEARSERAVAGEGHRALVLLDDARVRRRRRDGDLAACVRRRAGAERGDVCVLEDVVLSAVVEAHLVVVRRHVVVAFEHLRGR